LQKNAIYEVLKNEKDGVVNIGRKIGPLYESFFINAFLLDLAHSVEDQEPYNVFIVESVAYVRKGEQIIDAYYLKLDPNAEELAETLCARLNAEHRKEQSNGLGH
jgi:hypothetical protein